MTTQVMRDALSLIEQEAKWHRAETGSQHDIRRKAVIASLNAALHPPAIPPPQPLLDLAVRISALKQKGRSGIGYYGLRESWNDAIDAAANLILTIVQEEESQLAENYKFRKEVSDARDAARYQLLRDFGVSFEDEAGVEHSLCESALDAFCDAAINGQDGS